MDQQDIVFISYAREDRAWAERLYMDLRKQEINAWLDIRCLRAGSNWKHEIPKVIRRAKYFLLLISKHSINKRGYVQKEIKEGLDVLQELPTDTTFIIPVKLDETDPVDVQINELNWVYLFPRYHDGLARILSVFADLQKTPLKIVEATAPTVPIKLIDKGEVVVANAPLLIGERASISYAPFRTAKEFLQQFFDRLPTASLFGDVSLSYYVKVLTQHPHVSLGEDLLRQYPTEILLIFQNLYKELQIREHGISVVLSFGGKERTVGIPYEAIVDILVPEIGLHISIDPSASTATWPDSYSSPLS